VFVVAVLSICVGSSVGLSAPSPPSVGAYASGTYRNILQEYGQTETAITNKVNAAWTSLFGGGANTVYYTAGTDMAYILSVQTNDVRTEGMSYGMMIAVQMNEQTYFDKLFKWAVTYMRYNTPSDPNYLYYKWQVAPNGTALGTTPASDGETYFVTALIFAAGRWGSSPNFNYQTEYQNLLYKMIHVPSNTQGVTNLFDASTHQVVFCPTGTAATYTDPSYHTPAFYEVWAMVANSTADQTFWQTAATSARTFFTTAVNSIGLNPDYSTFGGAIYTGNSDHQYFGFDAWRTVQNIAVDYAWWAADSRQIAIVNSVLSFFNSKGASYQNEYYLNGTVMSGTSHSQGHVGMNAVGALASNNNITWSFVAESWNFNAPTGTYRYYDGMLWMLSLLHISGNFKIYLPSGKGTTVASAASSTSGKIATSSTTAASTTGKVTTAAATTSTTLKAATTTTTAATTSTSLKAATTTTTGAASSTTGSSAACSSVTVTVNVTQSWGGTSPQGNLDLIVKNTGSRTVSSITVTFSTPISGEWTGIVASSTAGQYVVTVNAAAGVTVVVQGATFTGQQTAPTVVVKSIAC